MKIIEKVKGLFKDAIKEHRLSLIVFFIAMLCWAINYDDPFFGLSIPVIGDVLDGSRQVLMGVSFGLLLCEAIHLYKKDDDNYIVKAVPTLAKYTLIVFATAAVVFQNWIVEKIYLHSDVENSMLYREFSSKILFCGLATVFGLTLFFFYKRSKESFETYLAKAFCGIMKAELVYGIIAIGMLLIIWAFDTLIIDTSDIDLIERIEILIVGLVQFPCAVAGLSKTEGSIGKFAKVVLSYVFTIMTAIAFVIIYIYIIKILVTWSFPSNQVFTILASLFCTGVIIWTMAQGCCDEVLVKPLKIMPLLYIPFIVLQIMCLMMRVSELGFTAKRYFGLALIIAEIIYFIIYIIALIKKNNITYLCIFIIIIGSYLVYLVPGVNVDSVVTASQKKAIEAYISNMDSSATQKKAGEAFRTIEYEGGFAGQRYLKTLTKEQKEKIEDYRDDSSYSSYDDYFYVDAEAKLAPYDIAKYDKLYIIDNTFGSEYDSDKLDFNLNKIPITSEGNTLGYLDLTDEIALLIKLEKEGEGYNNDKTSKVIAKSFKLSQADYSDSDTILIIRNLSISGYYNDKSTVDSIRIEGYVLENNYLDK